jgi:hypothetical protein
MKKWNFTFNLKLAFSFKKNYTSSTREGGEANMQVDPNKTKFLMTMFLALGPWIGFVTACLNLFMWLHPTMPI